MNLRRTTAQEVLARAQKKLQEAREQGKEDTQARKELEEVETLVAACGEALWWEIE